VEGAEFKLLQGALSTITMNPKPTWLIEICLTEHYPQGLNPNFMKVFEIFWKNGYEARTADKDQARISMDDVEKWVENRERGFGSINFIFKEA
jgi:hypothetical protein